MDWQQVALQVPGMAVLGIIVYLFLKFNKGTAEGFSEMTTQQQQLVSGCVDQMADTHKRTCESLDRNTEMFGRVENQLEHLERQR